MQVALIVLILAFLADGYSESDIRYIWAKGKDSVSLVEKLELPQFKVVGYKQDQKHVSMSTGEHLQWSGSELD